MSPKNLLRKKFKKIKYEDLLSEINPAENLPFHGFIRARMQISDVYRVIQLESKMLEEKEPQIYNSFELDMITRVDHITLILEDFLNTNKEILKKLEYIDKESFNQNNVAEEEMIEIQDLSEEVIEKIILDYIEKNKGKEIYPSDIAFAFNLNAENVFNICQKLKKEGKLIERTY